MLRALFATGALLAATAAVAHVQFSATGVSVGGKPVTENTLQLREAGDGTVLASREKVESLGGLVEVALGEGRTVSLEPGVRLARSEQGWLIATHMSRPMRLSSGLVSIDVASPAILKAVVGGWLLEDGTRLEGNALRAGTAGSMDIAAHDQVPPDDLKDEDVPSLRTEREKRKHKLNNRRIIAEDPTPGAEAADEQALKAIVDVSPAGF